MMSKTIRLASYKEAKLNETLYLAFCEFDGNTLIKGVVTKVEKDHIIVTTEPNNSNYWVDKDTRGIFRTEEGAKAYIKETSISDLNYF